MSTDTSEQLLIELKRLRDEARNLEKFRSWVFANTESLNLTIPPGYLLKLKRGEMQHVMRVSAALIPSCIDCRDLCEGGVLLTRQQSALCTSTVSKAMQLGFITPSHRPPWFAPRDIHFGADAYFKCRTCGALYTLVAPEGEDNGLWERFA